MSALPGTNLAPNTGAMPNFGSTMNIGSPSPMATSALSQGYQSALANLQKALQLSNQTTSGQLMDAKRQLRTNQGQIQQGLINKGLGNTTVLPTMMQAPIRTYNQATADIKNQGALRGMQAYGNLANMSAQGGQSFANLFQPYDQSQYAQHLQNQQNYLASLQNLFNSMNGSSNFGLSDMSGGGGSSPTPEAGSYGMSGAPPGTIMAGGGEDPLAMYDYLSGFAL